MTSPLQYCQLNTGALMPLLGLGVYDMYRQEAEQAVLDALETGYRLIDTATMYGNEKEIGNAIRKSGIRREEVFVTTKLNNPDQGYESALKAFDRSLSTLNIDYIDLYLIHWPIRGKRKDSWLALESLYREKRVRAIGVANYLIPFLEELQAYASIVPAVNQVEFSPFLYQQALKTHCEQKGIQLQAYTPLVRGKRFNHPTIVHMAAKHGKTPAQVMLRWNIQHQVSAIPKSSNRQRLKENFAVFDFELDDKDMKEMDQLNEDLRVVDDPISYF